MTWKSMIARCHCKTRDNFHLYGGRGITVCKRWRTSFKAFIEDMGRRPSPDHSIDRIDNNDGYHPYNCRWSTQVEQIRNSRTVKHVTIGGITKCISDWASSNKIKKSTVSQRLKRGWAIEDAVTVKTGRYKKV